MNIQPKPDELLYAQTAAYVHDQPHPYNYKLGRDVGNVAVGLLAGNDVTAENERWNGEIEVHTLTPDAYRDFLRHADAETRSDIAFLAQKQRAFADFRTDADATL